MRSLINDKAYNRVQKQKIKCIACVSASCSFNTCGLFLRKAQTLETFRNLLRENVSWERCSLGILIWFFFNSFTNICIKMPAARALHGALPNLHSTITLNDRITFLLPSYPHIDPKQHRASNMLASSNWPLN